MKESYTNHKSFDEDILQSITKTPEVKGIVIHDTLDLGVFINNHYIEEGIPFEIRLKE
jgi:hypothetical protein